MTDTIENEIDNVEDVQEAADEAVFDSNDNQEPVEDRARRMGWKPQEEYKGKDTWVDAETFLDNTETDLPQLKKSLRTLERTLQKQEKNTEAILAYHERQLVQTREQSYKQAIKDVEARHAQAVEDGDLEGAQKALKARDSLREQELVAVKQPSVKAEDSTVEEWKAKNTWFDTDPVLQDAAAKYTDILARQGKSVEEQLIGAEKYVRETFPQKFRQPKEAPHMGGSGNNTTRPKAKSGTYEALTPEAKAECDRTVKGSGGKITATDWLQYATPDMFRG